VGVFAGLGSFGVHHLVITDAGCAGRFSSVVLDAPLPVEAAPRRERCLYFHDGSCLECVVRCPAAALDPETGLDKQACSQRCQEVGRSFGDLDLAEVCGKCALGPCSSSSAVADSPDGSQR
jgi:epoxyqueuosine reductase QueG